MAGFASMLHGAKIDLGFIYKCVLAPRSSQALLTFSQHDWYLHGSCAPSSRCDVLLVSPGICRCCFVHLECVHAVPSSLPVPNSTGQSAVGFIGGVITWLTLANKFSGSVTVSTVGKFQL